MKALSKLVLCSNRLFYRSVALLLGTILATSALADLTNISTRAYIETGDRIAIGGFVISKADPANPDGKQCVVVRGRGQSVSITSGKLPDPYLILKQGSATLDENDDWQQHEYAVVLQEFGLQPGDATDAAIYACLDPGTYTALVRGGGTGIGIVEVVMAGYYDVSEILSVKLWSDTENVLAGDVLDVAASPTLYGASTFDALANVLNVSVASAGTVAEWPSAFAVGKIYDIQGTAAGIGGNIEIYSGTQLLRTIRQDGPFSFQNAINDTDLTIVATGASTAVLTFSVHQAVTLNWNVSNATVCTTSGTYGDWNGYSIVPDATGKAQGSLVLPIEVPSEQNIRFELTCDNPSKPAVADVVTVAASYCLTSGNVDTIKWSDLLFAAGTGQQWPDPNGNYANVRIDENTTKAIEFNTSTADIDEVYDSISNPEFPGTPGSREISISRCPGQFDGLPSRCHKSGYVNSGAIYWEIDKLAGDLAHTCKLDRAPDGATYYFNIRFESSCGTSSCWTRVQP